NAVRLQFEGGDLVGTAALDAAHATLAELVSALAGVRGGLHAALALPAASASGLAGLLAQRYEEVAAAEVVDVGNVRQTFVDAIGTVQELVEGLQLERVQQTVDELFARLDGLVQQADLGQLMPQIEALQAEIGSTTQQLDAE